MGAIDYQEFFLNFSLQRPLIKVNLIWMVPFPSHIQPDPLVPENLQLLTSQVIKIRLI